MRGRRIHLVEPVSDSLVHTVGTVVASPNFVPHFGNKFRPEEVELFSQGDHVPRVCIRTVHPP